MLFKYDITFCSDNECLRTDCERHPSHTPKGVPYSMADLSSHDAYYCAYYWPGYEEGENESSRNTGV